MSELYGVTIDAILREDEQIQREVKVQQTVASRRLCFYKTGQIGMFVLAFWVIIAIFWLGGGSVRTLYSILVPYALLPTLTLVFGASLGADELWRWEKCVFLLFGGATNMLWYAMTYGHANVLAHEKSFVQWLEYACELKQFCIGVTLATVGLIIGLVLKSVKRKTIKHLVISESQEK